MGDCKHSGDVLAMCTAASETTVSELPPAIDRISSQRRLSSGQGEELEGGVHLTSSIMMSRWCDNGMHWHCRLAVSPVPGLNFLVCHVYHDECRIICFLNSGHDGGRCLPL